jgi:hypothetical protein
VIRFRGLVDDQGELDGETRAESGWEEREKGTDGKLPRRVFF